VTVTASGFSKTTLPEFSLEAVETPTLNVTLQVGAATTTVNVSGSAPILNTSDPTISSHLPRTRFRIFRSTASTFPQSLCTEPGVVDTAGTSGPTQIERSNYFVDTPNMNGNRAQANNYTLDGIDINETFNNLMATAPPRTRCRK